MALRLKGLLRHSVGCAALAAALIGGSGVVHAVQPAGLDQLGDALPHSRALRVLREMQKDSVKVDSRHYQAAQRCDRAAMAEYQRQLDALAAQARNVIRNASLERDTSSNAIEADRIAANIEMRARHAASRQPQNCGDPSTEQKTGTTGTSGTASTTSAERLRELQIESVRLNSLHYQAAQRCDRAEMDRIQAELDKLAEEAGRIMFDARIGPRGTSSARFKNAEKIAHNIAGRADEACKRRPSCPDGQQQGASGQQPTCPPPPPPAQPPGATGQTLEKIGDLQRRVTGDDAQQVARQQLTIDSFEAAIAELERLVEQGRLVFCARTFRRTARTDPFTPVG